MAKKREKKKSESVSSGEVGVSSSERESVLSWVATHPEGSVLFLKIQPKASKSEWTGLHGDPPRLKVKVAALPEDGKANRELMDFLSDTFKKSKSSFELLRGHSASQKDVLCRGVSVEEVKLSLSRWVK